MLRIPVLATAVTNLTDARYFAARGVEGLIFQLESGASDAIAPVQVKAIAGWVDGVSLIGSLSMPTPADLREAAAALGLDAFLIGAFTPLGVLRETSDLELYQEIVLQRDSTLAAIRTLLEQRASRVDAFVIDAVKGRLDMADLRAGLPFALDELAELAEEFPIYLHTSASARDLPEFDDWNLRGLLVRGGEEEKVGFKSFDELDDWLDALEVGED